MKNISQEIFTQKLVNDRLSKKIKKVLMDQFEDITDVKVILNVGIKIYIGPTSFLLSKFLKHSYHIELKQGFSVDLLNTPQKEVIRRYKKTLQANDLIKDIFRFIQKNKLMVFEEINFLDID